VPNPVPTLLLAASPSPVPEPIDPARVTPGVLGFLAIIFLAVSVFLLWRSMNKQIRKIEFEGSVPVDPEPEAPSGADGAADEAGQPVGEDEDPAAPVSTDPPSPAER
jgi:hypothetical protein